MANVGDNGPPLKAVFLMQKINLRKENIMTEETNEQVQPVQSVQQPVQEETTTIYASPKLLNNFSSIDMLP